ncbi:MAG: class I SAM-dependent methyltransferase [Candidatus Anammoxibacter sp.]
MWKQLYQCLARYYQIKDWNFMNYGYAPLDDQTEIINLDETDLDNRFCIQLYHHVADTIDLRDLNVLEVGSGRGGGADYINRYLKPKKMVGVDFAENAVKFCNRNYVVNGLSFEVGNAEALHFADDSFDVVINVESSHCYGSMDAFICEVERVLRKGGYFLFADLRIKEKIEDLQETLYKSGLALIKETDITLNIIEALKLDNERKAALIKKSAHKLLVKPFLEFAGAKGSKVYERLESRETIYLSFVLQK